MFGDDYMAFRQNATIDSKYRMVVPSQTGVEKDETLYLMYNSDRTHLIISKATYLLKKIEQLQKQCLETSDTKKYMELSKDKEYYSSLIVQVLKVDEQRRVLLGKRTKNLIGPNAKQVFLSGQADEVHIFNDEEEYQRLYGHAI